MRYFAGIIFAIGSLIAWILSFFKAGSMPDRVPMHWNMAGQVDRYGSKWEGLLFIPIFLIAFSVIFGLIGLVAAKRLGPNTSKGLNITAAALAVFMIVIHQAILAGDASKIVFTVPTLMSGLLVVLGFAIRGVEPNPFIGIRVPWTMNSAMVWRKTHDRASKLWICGGLIGLILAFMGVPMGVTIAIFMGCVLYPLIDSYKISKSS